MIKPISEIKKWLKDNLDNERYIHSLSTAICAASMAKKFGLDEEKAYLTGLVHDCAKCISTEKSLEILDKIDWLNSCELINPKTYHAPCGAYIAENEFGITDKEILSAIASHTIGKIGMSTFEKVIYLADKIETETRDKNWCYLVSDVLEEENGLNKALLACYSITIKSLVDRNLKICLPTIEIYNELLNNIKT